jgi:phosphate acyltransferase
MGDTLFKTIKAEAKSNPVAMVGGALLKPTLKKMYRRFDPFEIGGAVLLGVNGVVIVGHGRSSGYAVKNAIRQAKEAVENGVVQAIQAGLKAGDTH